MGHGCGDGTPAGVSRSRSCERCGATEWRDTAVSTPSGGTRRAQGWTGRFGEESQNRPECAGMPKVRTAHEKMASIMDHIGAALHYRRLPDAD